QLIADLLIDGLAALDDPNRSVRWSRQLIRNLRRVCQGVEGPEPKVELLHTFVFLCGPIDDLPCANLPPLNADGEVHVDAVWTESLPVSLLRLGGPRLADHVVEPGIANATDRQVPSRAVRVGNNRRQ